MKIAAAILTGGKSSRMGRDKSLLRLKGKTLTALCAGKLLKAGYAPVFVVGPRKAYGLPKGVEVVAERFRGKGPLSGVEAALRHAKSECLMIPCDLPLISLRTLRRLRLEHQGKLRGFPENPLPAVFLAGMLPQVQKALAAGKLAIYPWMRKAKLIQGVSKRSLFNVNDLGSFKIVRSDKRVV